MANSIVCVPMKLDAFVLNRSLCAPPPRSTIAPITQPNYTFLRLDSDFLIESDVLPPVDLHAAGDPATNSRVTNVGTGDPLTGRFGVYIHWIMPRFYRAGVAATDGSTNKDERARRARDGFPDTQGDDPDHQSPHFRSTPDRWLVVRRLHLDTVRPTDAVSNGQVTEFQAWVIESDCLRAFDELDKNVDMEVDASPFIQGAEDNLDVQAETFIGLKTDARKWTERGSSVPRVDVGILNSSNQLFADYVPHNGNVFSMLDNFQYTLQDGTTIAQLTEATASYHVIGWHSKDKIANDPFNIVQIPGSTITHQTRLDGCKMTLVQTPGSEDQLKTWLQSSDSTGILCHGSMYSVQFSSKPPTLVLADKTAALFAKTAPIAVGTTPLDAILSFVQVHLKDNPTDSVESKLLHSLSAIAKLLLKQEEDVDSQAEAADMLSSHNFGPASGGSVWHLSGQSQTAPGAPTQPTPDQINALSQLNELQQAVDEASRELRQNQWEMWSLWWTYVSAVRPSSPDMKVKNAVIELSFRISDLQKHVDLGQRDIKARSDNFPYEKGARDSFYTLRDPTVLIPGVKSPWPTDFLDNLRVRLDYQLVGPQSIPLGFSPGWSTFSSFVDPLPTPTNPSPTPGVIKVLPTFMQQAAKGLLYEFFQLHPPDSGAGALTPAIPAGAVMPLYHDADPKISRDLWNQTQPWFPLFLEWEAKYFHIPFEKWAFEQVTEPDALGATQTRMRYGVMPNETLVSDDVRTIYGRSLILPQPTFSLKANITTLLANTPEEVLKAAIGDKAEREGLVNLVDELAFLSSPMSGFTDHLITRIQGTHIKPTRRRPGQGLEALTVAIREEIELLADQIMQMGVETNTTPYAQEIRFPQTLQHSPFKPATHGQFCFTKLNVIDKFGQAVSAIDPTPSRTPPSLYPVISEYYRPQVLASGMPHTVKADPPGRCQYMQIPPNLNQDARLNAAFLTRDTPVEGAPPPPWRPALEWESPIWGWIVVNYVEEGLQVFLPDGTFYREVRLGGVTGATTGAKWKPFEAPTTAVTSAVQLDKLLEKLADATFLRDFIGTLNLAMAAVPEAPNDYAEFMSAIIGKPLALVNVGFSLELSTPPLKNQSTLAPAGPDKPLLDYTFLMKLGAHDRVYDGLIGFFNGSKNPSDTTGPPAGQELDLGTMYTYYATSDHGDAVKDITVDVYTRLQPYKLQNVVNTPPASLHLQHNGKFEVVGAVIDPFTPLHGYLGSVLPIKALSLPPWSVQMALKVMTAFFTMGPLIVTSPDIQDRYDATLRLTKNLHYSPLVSDDATGNVAHGKGVPIPALKSADWMWLQPYMEKDKEENPVTEWNPMGIEALDNRPKFEDAPYTAIEGYLQLRKALDGSAVGV